MTERGGKTDTIDLPGSTDANAPLEAGLVVTFAPDPDALPTVISLSGRGVVLGREPPPSGVMLPFGSVSRLHARASVHGREVRIEDLESRNGTFVNGHRIHGVTVISAGDDVRLGEVSFAVVIGDLEARAAWPLAGRPPTAPVDELRGGFALDRIRREIVRTAKAGLSILVLGESGSGKELVARAIHRASERAGELATVNCAAIPATLLESELFGHKRGAFTGADRDRLGLVRSADGGTLFLDEIGDMPLEAQAKLLRCLETRTVTPLGSHVAEPVDIRIVCATHRSLQRLVAEERFRGDLYARIAGHTIMLPSLRGRREDIVQLARFFLDRAGGAKLGATPAFMNGLVSYAWPYNVRELEAAIRRAVALSDGTLDARHLPADATASVPENEANAGAPDADALRELLRAHHGNVAAVARALGKDRTQVHRWLRRFAITLDEFRAK